MSDRAMELREAVVGELDDHRTWPYPPSIAPSVLAAIVETLGVTEEDVKNARGGKHIPYPTHTNVKALRKLVEAWETLLEASRND